MLIWGCPALRAGRAVSGLAGLLGPAQNFAALILLGLRLRRPLIHPSARLGKAQPSGAKRILPELNTTVNKINYFVATSVIFN